MSSIPCFCTFHKCDGRKIRSQDFSRHRRQDEERRRQIAACTDPTVNNSLVNQVYHATLNGNISTSDAIWGRETHVVGVSLDTLPASVENSTSGLSKPPPSYEQPSHARSLYHLLLSMDHKIEAHVKVVGEIMLKSVASEDPLKQEEQWFRDILHNVHAVNPCGDKATVVLRSAMIDRVINQLGLIEAERTRLGHLANIGTRENVFNSGKQLLKTHSMR